METMLTGLLQTCWQFVVSYQLKPHQMIPAASASTEDANSLGTVALSDTSVLDCPICYDPLTAPVFQCINGHTACSLCCITLKNKCPLCSEKIGHIRCRALESVLEAVKVPCPYKSFGCTGEFTYSSILTHKTVCVYAPLRCPFIDCGFAGSHLELSTHINRIHTNSVIPLRFDQVCRFSAVHKKFVVFREVVGGTIFILAGSNLNTISCIYGSDVSVGDRFAYDLISTGNNCCFRFQSYTVEFENRPMDNGDNADCSLEARDGIELCIWSKE